MTKINTSFTHHMFIVIHGMPGVGKTAVAREFRKRHENTYQDTMFLDMNLEFYDRDNVTIDAICKKILRKFQVTQTGNVVTHDASDRLQSKFKELVADRKYILIILDNLDEFLPRAVEKHRNCRQEALKHFISLTEKAAQTHISILGTSREKVAEFLFPGVLNLELSQFSPEESKEYLSSLESADPRIINSLHNSSCGFPLILELLYRQVKDKQNIEDIVRSFEAAPQQSVLQLSPSVRLHLSSALERLSEKEMEAVELLSFFGRIFSFQHADELFRIFGLSTTLLLRLKDMGLFHFTDPEYRIHEFLKEIINEKVKEQRRYRYTAGVCVVYIKGLLNLSRDSFEKDKSKFTVGEFWGRKSYFDHLITLLTSNATNEEYKREVAELMQRTIFKEFEPCSFYFLVRFLYFMVQIKHIATILSHLVDACRDEQKRSMLLACIDEIQWEIIDRQPSDHSPAYEYVMSKRRVLKKTLDNLKKSRPPKEATDESAKFNEELSKLQTKVETLENEKLRAFYTIKVNNMLANFVALKRHFIQETLYFKKSIEISEATFGDSIWTINSIGNLAMSFEENGETDKAIEQFKKAIDMAESTGFIRAPRVLSLLLRYVNCCLNAEIDEETDRVFELTLEYSSRYSTFDSKDEIDKLCNAFYSR